MPTFAVDGVSLYYETRGGGDPVVLLHGFTSLGRSWARLGWVDLLVESRFRAVVLDFRSHGRSDRVYDRASCSTEQLAADVVALLDHLGIAHASLFGFSMGGGVALRVAMDQPARVKSVVIGGVGNAALNRLHDPREIEQLTHAFRPNARAVEQTKAGRIRRNAELAGNGLDALLPFLEGGGWPGGLDDTRPVRAPVLMVTAEDDEYMADTDAISDWLAPPRIVTAAGRSHHDVLHDDAVKQAVVDFLRHVTGRTTG